MQILFFKKKEHLMDFISRRIDADLISSCDVNFQELDPSKDLNLEFSQNAVPVLFLSDEESFSEVNELSLANPFNMILKITDHSEHFQNLDPDSRVWGVNRNSSDSELNQTFRSICQIANLEKRLKKISGQIERDPLTGLLNKRGLEKRFKKEVALASRHEHKLTVVFVDIDNFKSYNDSHGHEQGDRLLQAISKVLKDGLRLTDHISRFGGDEFVLILPHAGSDEAFTISDRLRKEIAEANIPYAYTLPGGHLTVSMGIASWPGQDCEAENLLECSDRALLSAKSKGKNQVRLFSDLKEDK